MALPFILGLAVGAGAVIAYNKSDKLKEKTSQLVDKSKDLADDTLEKTKKNINEIKEKICTKKEKTEDIIKDAIDDEIKEDK